MLTPINTDKTSDLYGLYPEEARVEYEVAAEAEQVEGEEVETQAFHAARRREGEVLT